MSHSLLVTAAAVLIMLSPTSILYAQDIAQPENSNHVSLGIAMVDQHTPFNSASSLALAIPLISIRQGAYYFEIAETGFHFDRQMAGVTPSIDLFVAARSPQERDRLTLSADAGARISLDSKLGKFSAEFRHDITDKFNGSEIIVRYAYPVSAGPFTFIPAVQASWLDRKAANYMYGVTAAQRARMIRKQRPVILPVAPITDDALNLGGDISMLVRISSRLTLIAVVSGTYLDKSIYRSPAIEQKWQAQSVLGLTYRF